MKDCLMKEYDKLIIAQLVEHGDSGFMDLLRYIHEYQGKRSTKEYAMKKSKLSKRTLQLYLDNLEKHKLIKRKKGKTSKREIFGLTEKSGQFVFSTILIEFVQLKDTLDFYDKKPFFGFFETGSQPQVRALVELRDALKEITNRLDGYLKTVEVEK